MADDGSEQDLRDTSAAGQVKRVFQRLRGLSRQSSKSTPTDPTSEAASPTSLRFGSPESLPPLPLTPNPQYGSQYTSSPTTSPLETIQRCPSGKFHPNETCDGSCSARVPIDIEALENALSPRRPSAGSGSGVAPPSFVPTQPGTPRHRAAQSRSSVDIHAIGSAASLRRPHAHKRPNHSSREISLAFPHLVRSDSANQNEKLQNVVEWRAQVYWYDDLENMASRPESMMVPGGPREYKKRAIQEAQLAQDAIDKWFAREDSPFKGRYEFKELIGKGSYGRVYKSIEKATGHLVAIKVLSPDEQDINIPAEARDHSLQEVLREINILERLQQSNAVNINEFVEAGTVHSQLWIVSDYCSGGSLTTLKRAAGNKIDEEPYIRIIARELAKGLASVHKAGIIHRDIKCANIMVSENGALRIIDFGVSGVLQTNMDEDKRKTVIGTLHWMAPEIQHMPDKEVLHGAEVDVWAYGVTLYECAMGNPPNPGIGQVSRLRAMTKQSPPRLPNDMGFSADLKDLVAFCCNPDPTKRPTMDQVCDHPYNVGTETEHPTHALRSLVENYYNWERSGGHRISLFQPGGAQQANIPAVPPLPGQDEWVFSTTADFDQQHEAIDDGTFDLSSSPPREADEFDDGISMHTLRPSRESEKPATSAPSRAEQDAGARRGARNLAGLFDHSAAPYKFGESPATDLPLRSGTSSSSLHSKELSFSSNDDGPPQIDLEAINKKKRATMAWKWTTDGLPSDNAESSLPPPRPTLQHANTFAGEPSTARDARQTLDLDSLMNPDQARRARETLDLDSLMNTDQARQARETLDLDSLMNPETTRQARETLDLDALMNPEQLRRARETLDLDSLMNPSHGQQSTRDTLDLDQLMGGAPPAHPVHAQDFAATMSGPRPEVSDNRQTLDLDALMQDTGNGALAPAFTYTEPSSEATMRPASQYPHIRQSQVQGLDFAAQQPEFGYQNLNAPAHTRQISQQSRPATLDLDSLMNGGNAAMLDAMMAGEHDFEGPSSNEASVGDPNASYATRRAYGDDRLGLSSSPPSDSPFGGHIPSLPLIPDYPMPINPLALRDDAPRELMQSELRRLLGMFSHVLNINHDYLGEASRVAGPARHSRLPSANGHSRATSSASSIRDDTSSRDEGAEGDREDE